MNKIISSLSAIALFAAAAPAIAAEPVELWRTSGFSAPESVVYDPGTDAIYVSNVNGDDVGAGFISKLNRDGSIAVERFAEGLTQPRGTAVLGGKLYVASPNQISVVDLATAEVQTFDVPGAIMLNGLDVAPDGTVYASDTMGSSIYTLREGMPELWVQDPALLGINGVEVDGDRVIVVRLGDLSGGFANIIPGDAKQIDIASKAISDFGTPGQIGVFDGVDMAEGGILATDFVGGKLVFIPESGDPVDVLATGVTSFADHHYYPELDGLVLVPVTMENEVIAYSWVQ